MTGYTMIKLLTLYTFNDTKSSEDLSGIWETVGVRDIGATPQWDLVRRYSTALESPVGTKLTLPGKVLEMFAKRINRLVLTGEPIV